MNKEKLIEQIMKEALADGEPLTREEAEEVAEMEIKAKGITNYVATEKTKSKKPKVKKVDEEKAEIIKILEKALTNAGYPAIIVNEDKVIDFGQYTVNLIKHRPPKA